MRIRELVFVTIGVTLIQAVFGFLFDLSPATKRFWALVRG
jgi:hypothetical protein